MLFHRPQIPGAIPQTSDSWCYSIDLRHLVLFHRPKISCAIPQTRGAIPPTPGASQQSPYSTPQSFHMPTHYVHHLHQLFLPLPPTVFDTVRGPVVTRVNTPCCIRLSFQRAVTTLTDFNHNFAVLPGQGSLWRPPPCCSVLCKSDDRP